MYSAMHSTKEMWVESNEVAAILELLSKVYGEKLSEEFCLESGVLQGLVLLPTLFLLVLDPLLKDLERKCLGHDLNGPYVGAFAHADDICTICSSRDTLHIECIENFVNNALSDAECIRLWLYIHARPL